MKRIFIRRIAAITPVIVLLALVAMTTDSNAQTTRRRTRSIPIPAPTATPSNDAEVIMRADELPDENSRAIPPDPNDPSGIIGADRTGISTLEELGNRIRNLEAAASVTTRKTDPDEKQKRLLLNLDILSRAEQRSDALRKQVFDLMEKENNVKTKLDSVEYDLRPEAIERSVALIGTLRPEELRASKRKSLESERAGLQSMLTEIQRTRSSLELSLQRADALVEKLRTKFEKDIDTALDDDPEDPQ